MVIPTFIVGLYCGGRAWWRRRAARRVIPTFIVGLYCGDVTFPGPHALDVLVIPTFIVGLYCGKFTS